jgi:hypothetical protein
MNATSIFIPLYTILLLLVITTRLKRQNQELKLGWFAVPYIILLSVLKYRAAHHVKARKWQHSGSSIEASSRFGIYLRELFYYDAKMSPISSPLLSDAWETFCYIIVWIIFPSRVSLAHLCAGGLYTLIKIYMNVPIEDYFAAVHFMVYNGQRCKLIEVLGRFAVTQDKDGNIFYYPILHLRRLISLHTVCE